MVNRRQLLKISALGTASFAAPQAYPASKITMDYNTGNPPGSSSPKDLIDNAEDLDYLLTGDGVSHLNRLGGALKSWKGMEGEHDSAQTRRESEFDADQAERVDEFNALLESSGFEIPVDYFAGVAITRPTQVIRFGGELYRAKEASLPFTTTTWDADAAKLFSTGDAVLRQEFFEHGADMSGFADSVAPGYLKTLSDIANSEPVSLMRFIPRGSEQSALYAGTSTSDFTANIDEALDAMVRGGELTIPPVTFNHMGLTSRGSRNLKITGQGWKSSLKNNSTSGAPCLLIASADIEERAYGLDLSCFTLEGNPLSGNGLTVDRAGWYDHLGREASVTNIDRLHCTRNGVNGMQIGKSATEGAGNKTNITRSLLRQNGRTGLVILGQTNMVKAGDNSITLNGQDGVEMNQVASTNHISGGFIAENARYGAYNFRCEQPMYTHIGFNRNRLGALVLDGDATGASIKYTEAALIAWCLFGDNGQDASLQREITIRASRGTNLLGNYFYGTGQDSMIYLSDYAEGVMIAGNYPKNLTSEHMLELKVGGIDIFYTYDDDVSQTAMRNIFTSKVPQYVIGGNTTLLQTRDAIAAAAPRFRIRGDGRMEWSSGSAGFDVALERVNGGSLRVTGALEVRCMEIATGLTAPSAKVGYVRVYSNGKNGLEYIRPDGVRMLLTATAV